MYQGFVIRHWDLILHSGFVIRHLALNTHESDGIRIRCDLIRLVTQTMIRAFIAARLTATPDLCRLLQRMSGLGRAVRPVAAENLHLTLRFLGQIEPAQTIEIAAAMRAAAVGVAAFDVQLVGVGAFPRPDRPSVIWVGVHGTEPLAEIVQVLDPKLDSLGLSRADKPWQAHLTVARVKAKPDDDLIKLLGRSAETDFGWQSIDSLQLVESQLGPKGPTYMDLDRIDLRGQDE